MNFMRTNSPITAENCGISLQLSSWFKNQPSGGKHPVQMFITCKPKLAVSSATAEQFTPQVTIKHHRVPPRKTACVFSQEIKVKISKQKY